MEAPRPGSSRRVLLSGTLGTIGAVGAAGALAGCEVYGDESPAPAPPPAEGEGEGGTVLASVDEVEVGGGLILEDQNVVITQPAQDTFKAFTATCTHQGCTVTSVEDGAIVCACHGSRFSIEDGAVVQAAQGLSPDEQDPLPEAGITVNGDEITLA